jgi:hypothetical protein
MRRLALLLLALLASDALAGGCHIRVGYSDQATPPYYFGAGPEEGSPPGASVELIREIAAAAGCTVAVRRLPPARLAVALEQGTIDMSPLGQPHSLSDRLAHARDRNGKLDDARGLQLHTVVYVRAADRLPQDTDPMQYFRHHRLGTPHGVSYAAMLRSQGIELDDGAADMRRNLEKLKLGRIDGFAISLASPGDMDQEVAALHGADVVRLERPIRSATIHLLLNKEFYAAHREQAEAMWTWLGTHGRARFAALLDKYR